MNALPENIRSAPPFAAFLADMAALGVTPVETGGRRHAVVAARSNPRWWLPPLDNRRAAAAGLDMLQPVTPAAKAAKLVMRGLARFGPHRFLGRGYLRLSGLPEIDGAFVGAFNGRAAHIACFTGTDGPHRKTALQVMDEKGAILGYAKLSRAGHVRPYLRNEAAMLGKVADLGLRIANTPAVLTFRDDEALTLLITDSRKSAGHVTPLEPGIAHLAFLNELRIKTERFGAGATLDTLTRRAGELASLAGPDWTARIARAIAALRPHEQRIRLCLAHGDFTPWNSFQQTGRLYVFDWEYAADDWPVGFDLAHFMLAPMAPDRQAESLPLIIRTLADAYFTGDAAPARRALLLSLLCHAVFYLGRLDEAGDPLAAWTDGPARARLIDLCLAEQEAET